MAKILIVDDSHAFRIDLRETLEKAGYEVVEAGDGLDGLTKAEEMDDIGLILADYNMPGMDGLSMVKKIKEMERYRSTPVGILTSESSKELRRIGKGAGVTVWIVKPVEWEQLLAVAGAVIKR